jgi:hypothetical protein
MTPSDRKPDLSGMPALCDLTARLSGRSTAPHASYFIAHGRSNWLGVSPRIAQ